MKTYHIFNGDCLEMQLQKAFLEDEKIIWRDCLIEGPVSVDDFWQNRFAFLSKTYNATSYDFELKIKMEFQKFQTIEETSNIYFWFEDDLFCQLNFWFLLSNISLRNTFKLYRVFPESNNNWEGFSKLESQDSEKLISKSELISKADLILGQELWLAFQQNDLGSLKILSQKKSVIFRRLEEVISSLIDLKEGKIQLEFQKLNAQFSDFESFFRSVQLDFGVYGFGDSQVKNLL